MKPMIYPGKPWMDENGKRIQAHGAGMYYEDGTFYWYGENKEFTDGKNKNWTWGIKYYSSRDLCSWKDEGFLIEAQPEKKESPFYPRRKLDRPHIVKNPNTGRLIMYLKYSDTADFTICSADKICGPWKIEKEGFKAYGRKCGDFDLEVDENGTGYLYVEVDHKEVISCRLTKDFLDTEGAYAVHYEGLHPPLSREGVTHFARNGKHYIVTSGMIGYVPNPSQWAIGDDWMGPYTDMGDPHVNDESSASFNSQISYIFKHPEKKDLYIAMADRWVPGFPMTKEKYENMAKFIGSNYDKSIKLGFFERFRLLKQLMSSPMLGSANTSVADYVWLPISFEGDKMSIAWKESWSPEDYE